MKDKSEAFEQWFEYYFCDYEMNSYFKNDIQIAFFAGWEKHKETIQNKR